MRTKEILASVAVAAGVATVAYYGCDMKVGIGKYEGGRFLATPFTNAEREFINFIA